MRFMVLVKANKASEAGEMPSPEMLTEMNKFNEEIIKAGVMLDGNGLLPSSTGFRVTNTDGNIAITDGPFAESKELVAGYWIIQSRDLEEAIEWIKKAPFDVSGHDGQVEIRPVYELDDFPVNDNESGWREDEEKLRAEWESGGGPAIDPAKKLWLGCFLADENSEAAVMPTEQQLTDMNALMAEAAEAGLILGGEGLKPSSEGARIYFANGDREVVDGPFAETKELVAGFATLQFDSDEQAREWAVKAIKAHGNGRCELRRIAMPEDFDEATRAAVPEVFEAEAAWRERAR